MGSTRLPGKIMLRFGGSTILGHILNTLRSAGVTSERLIVATTTNPLDDVIEEYVAELGLMAVRGDESNVMHRYQLAAKVAKAENIVRLTADNPVLDMRLVAHCISRHEKDRPHLTSTRLINEELQVIRFVPKGSSVDIMTSESLMAINSSDLSAFDKEHVIPWYYPNLRVSVVKDYISDRPELSIDTLQDYVRVCKYCSSHGFF